MAMTLFAVVSRMPDWSPSIAIIMVVCNLLAIDCGESDGEAAECGAEDSGFIGYCGAEFAGFVGGD